jgi:hypothetical protein
MTNGFVFYEGPSLLDGAPIVGIVTGTGIPSANSKTGEMAQAWILHRDLDPSAAIKSGADRAICGDCQHRSADGNIGRSCYVIWWLGPMNVWKAYKAHRYTTASQLDAEHYMLGNHVRLGAYGDPAAIPYRAWLPIVRGSSGAIGYTQQWRTCDPMFARICMASVQSPAEKAEAHAKGWRTFRARPWNGAVLDDEVICPASNEANHSATCRECQLCQGNTKQAKSVAIIAHGQRAGWFAEAGHA